jgi:nucleotide-binding universal stress UspA family protein
LYQKILTPIDLSEPAMTQKAIAAAIEIAKMAKAQIRLVYVQALTPLAFMEYAPADFDERLRESTEGELTKAAAQIDYSQELVSTALRFGAVYPEVLAEAQSWGADLIVVGSHRPSMSTYLLGSNAKTIVRHANCSVLVARN